MCYCAAHARNNRRLRKPASIMWRARRRPPNGLPAARRVRRAAVARIASYSASRGVKRGRAAAAENHRAPTRNQCASRMSTRYTGEAALATFSNRASTSCGAVCRHVGAWWRADKLPRSIGDEPPCVAGKKWRRLLREGPSSSAGTRHRHRATARAWRVAKRRRFGTPSADGDWPNRRAAACREVE